MLAFLPLLLGSSVQAQLFEAEDGALAGAATVSTTRAGYSGAGYVTGFVNDADQVEIPVTVDATGSYAITIHYAAQFGDKNTRLSVNGVSAGEMTLIASATFATAEGPIVSLAEGANSLTILGNWGYYDIDAVELTLQEPPGGLRVEAEDGVLRGVNVDTTRPDYSGAGYVTGFDNATDSVDLIANIEQAGDYRLVVLYASQFGQKFTRFYLNGQDKGEIAFAQSDAFTQAAGPVLALEEGENVFTFVHNWGYYDIDAIILEFLPPFASAYEAEDGALAGVSESTDRAGFSGDGYVAGFDSGDDSVTIALNLYLTGNYQITLRYAAPFGFKRTRLEIDGADQGEVDLPEAAEWSSAVGPTVHLEAGFHELKILNNWGYYEIDRVDVDFVVPAVGLEFEAETGTTRGGARVASDHAGFSGSGYVTGFTVPGAIVDIPINLAEAGLYRIDVGYSTPFGEKNTRAFVNGADYGDVFLANNPGFAVASGPIAGLSAGLNTVSFETNWGFYEIDRIQLVPVDAPVFDIDPNPIDPNAAPETRALYQYLLDSFGQTILSGQTEQPTGTPEVEMDFLQSLTGKLPAIRNLDLLPYSAEGGWDDGLSGRAIAWHRQHNGIISMQWHWFAPAGGDSFYTDSTTFDITKAIDPTQPEYALAIADIDAIAAELGELAAARVPVIFRPLHEAEGGWFWWGAKGPAPAIELYKIIYDRLTNHHRLHNLIWVWNSVDPAWYPGNGYVDIVSFDVYRNPGDYFLPPSPYLQLAALSNNEKLITLAENGPIPDIDLLIDSNTLYSSFAPWWGDYITDGNINDAAHIVDVYSHPAVITRDELPELRAAKAVEVFSATQYKGARADLPAGDYTYQALETRGLDNAAIKSLRVSAGYVAKIYAGGNFTGPYQLVTGNRPIYKGTFFVPQVGSVRIVKTGP